MRTLGCKQIDSCDSQIGEAILYRRSIVRPVAGLHAAPRTNHTIAKPQAAQARKEA